ncbi:MAG: hypothetical protein DCF15_04995 [Phormidesmis priestleyi]|uniref:DUF5673 domain-containing protein n=1 Tax=Phormidesmis priestleyi TaxID=268141 RepID=A0A2W4ZKA4_9CYAN|nr:MAG: hypothetical protein DCF15_04995 [Phormidesmis priestleyi]
MSLNLEFVAFFLGFVAIALAIGYGICRVLLGPQAATRNLLYAGPWLLFGAVLAIALSLAGRFGLVGLYALYTGGVLFWLISWPLRKRSAGDLLHSIGPTSQNKIFLWVGLFQVGLAIAMTLLLLDRVTGGLVTGLGIASGIVQIAFWWSLALLFILLGRSNLEIREHGLCYLYAWQPWARVEAFGWDDDKPNTLILKLLPRSFISRRFITLTIPVDQKATVDDLIDDYLAEADLATEMDIAQGIEPPSQPD